MSDDSTGAPFDPHMPLPIEDKPGDEVWNAHTDANGDPDPTTPWGAACLWWQGLSNPVEYRHALDELSLNPQVWNGYDQAAGFIGSLSILSKVEDNADQENIKYVRFIEFGGEEAGQVFADAPTSELWVVTVVKPEGDDWWRVWGLSHNHFPTTAQVTGN